METQNAKFERFKALHHRGRAFVIPNAWDIGSARLLAAMGFEALATTSAGYAFSVGKPDSFDNLSQSEILENAKAIAGATDLPVSADLGEGFGTSPEACADTIAKACTAALVGGSIEDATGNPEDPIFDLEHSVQRIKAAAQAAEGKPFLLTARSENFLWGRPDLADTIKRLQAFSEAGADVLYAPGLLDIEAIKTLCAEVDKPVNVLMGLSGQTYSVQELQDVGASRISVGGSFARAAFGALRRAAQEVMTNGTFNYSSEAISGKELLGLLTEDEK